MHATRPTSAEAAWIASFDRTWDKRAIDVWLALVEGRDEVSDGYLKILARVREEFEFDVIVTWSENGAVRRMGGELGIPVVNLEYGPTREPFRKTFYMDAAGTNGHASVLAAPLDQLAFNVVPAETWVAAQATGVGSDQQIGLVDAGTTVKLSGSEYFIPARPYVFVPLQLADDLNTLMHSPYGSPLAFLQDVLPSYLKAGYDIVVKGHPGAAGRPYNLMREAEALRYAAALGERVQVVPRTLSAPGTINLIAQSSVVATINSSVGFEAILLGKNVALFGDAAYGTRASTAPGGVLHSQRDRWISFLCQHYFIPVDSLHSGGALITGLRVIVESYRQGALCTNDFWTRWVAEVSYGMRWATTGDANTPLHVPVSTPHTTLAGASHVLAAAHKVVRREGNDVLVVGSDRGRQVVARARYADAEFIGFIDEVARSEKSILVRGWVVEREGQRPAVMILLCVDSEVVSWHRVAVDRTDVARHLDGNVTAKVGFIFEIPGAKAPPSADVRLLFVSSGNRAQQVALVEGPLHRV